MNHVLAGETPVLVHNSGCVPLPDFNSSYFAVRHYSKHALGLKAYMNPSGTIPITRRIRSTAASLLPRADRAGEEDICDMRGFG